MQHHQTIARRRTVREYAPTAVPRAVIEHCLRAAGTAPSGANQQPWRFVVVQDAAIKHRIREAADRLLVGHPAPDCRIPDIQRLPLDGYASFL